MKLQLLPNYSNYIKHLPNNDQEKELFKLYEQMTRGKTIKSKKWGNSCAKHQKKSPN